MHKEMNVSKKEFKYFIYWVFLGLLSAITKFVVVKYFSLTTIAIIYNLNPIMTMMLGAIFLKEKVTYLNIACIILTFLAVVYMTIGLAHH